MPQSLPLHINSKVLIILMGALGDVVRGLHIADTIREAFPQCTIDWVVEPKCEGVVRLSPSVSSVVVFSRDKPVSGFLSAIKTIRNNHYDVVFDMQRHLKSGLFSFLSGAPRRIGFHKNLSKEGNFLFSTETIECPSEKENKFFTYRRFLKNISLSPLNHFRTKLIVENENHPEWQLSKPYLFVGLGSSWKSKNFDFQGYQSTLNNLIQTSSFDFVLVGGKDQSDISNKLVSQVATPSRIRNLVGKTSLKELVTVIKNSKGGFGPDSGPGHIAAALERPYVALFGATDPGLVAPVGMDDFVVRSGVGCSPCYKRECPDRGGVCMKAILPDTISKTVLRAVASS